MRVPDDAVIPRAKLTDYLLVFRPWDDKAGFLRRAGFSAHNPDDLERAIRDLAAQNDATEDGTNEYGTFLRVEGELKGPEGLLAVVAIWLRWHRDGSVHFVTLKPRKRADR